MKKLILTASIITGLLCTGCLTSDSDDDSSTPPETSSSSPTGGSAAN